MQVLCGILLPMWLYVFFLDVTLHPDLTSLLALWDKGRGRCAREPACEFWNEEMLLEAHERERDQEQPQGLEGMPAPPVRPFMLFRDFDTIFGGIMNPGQRLSHIAQF